MRRLLTILGSPLILAELVMIIFVIKELLAVPVFGILLLGPYLVDILESDHFDISFFWSFLAECIAIVVFCFSIIRAQRSIPFVHLFAMAIILFSALIVGHFTGEHVFYSSLLLPLSDTRRNVLAGSVAGLVAGLIMLIWRWVPGIHRSPILSALPWLLASGVVWGGSYYLCGKFREPMPLTVASCYGFLFFRAIGGSHLMWLSGNERVTENQ